MVKLASGVAPSNKITAKNPGLPRGMRAGAAEARVRKRAAAVEMMKDFMLMMSIDLVMGLSGLESG